MLEKSNPGCIFLPCHSGANARVQEVPLGKKFQSRVWTTVFLIASVSLYQTRVSTRLSIGVLLEPEQTPCHFPGEEHLGGGTVHLPCRWTPCCVSWFIGLPWWARGVENKVEFKHSTRVSKNSPQSDSVLTCKPKLLFELESWACSLLTLVSNDVLLILIGNIRGWRMETLPERLLQEVLTLMLSPPLSSLLKG